MTESENGILAMQMWVKIAALAKSALLALVHDKFELTMFKLCAPEVEVS